jgi:UDP-2,3-diacylglucosamine hydrolase
LPSNTLCYILADVHLQPDSHHPINQLFLHFLKHHAPHANQIFILGDLFESWVGDDIGLTIYQHEISALQALSQKDIAITILYGNRDFLMGKAFAKASGARLIKNDVLLETIQGNPFILLHGDTLCTDDQPYQKMRRWFHKPWVQWLFLALPKRKRLDIANKMRQQSGKATATKSATIMDVNLQAVDTLFLQYPSCQQMIHGHTHRPAQHLTPNGKTRWVLGDWHPQAAKLIKIENGLTEMMTISSQQS